MNNIREIRKSRGFTLKELGSRIGVAESTMSLYETGARSLDYDTLKKISDILDCPIDVLMGDEADRKPFSNADMMLFRALDGATDEDKERAAKLIMIARGMEF